MSLRTRPDLVRRPCTEGSLIMRVRNVWYNNARMNLFNKSFFRFAFGFVGILTLSIAVIVAVNLFNR